MIETKQSAASLFDVLVIGAGPGGYVAAIRAAQLGLKVACIDASSNAQGGPAPGGTCTNVGCIPSKALLQSSEHFEHAQLHFAQHGIQVKGVSMNVAAMQKRRANIITQNNDGILYLLKKNGITFIHGHAAFTGSKVGAAYVLQVTSSDGAQQASVQAPQVIIATGSLARNLPLAEFDENLILSNDGALSLDAVPARLGVIGAGVIGLEMGSVWRRLGAQVHVLEAMPSLLAAADESIAKEALKVLTKQGLKFTFAVKISTITSHKKGVSVHYHDGAGVAQTLEVDKLIVSVGRVPNTQGLQAQSVGLQLDERGAVVVDEHGASNLPGVWAVGDVVRGPMLAHKAEEEGVAVAERIAGRHGHVNLAIIPWVIYTSPEIAWVGQTEQELRAAGVAYRVGQFPFLANARARVLGDTTGFVKMLADAQTDEILGAHIIGPMASELVAELVMALEFRASAEDVARICHAHPSLSESTKDAAWAAATGKSINF